MWHGRAGDSAKADTVMESETGSLDVMREAVDAVGRFGARGCMGMTCDRVRGASIAHQLSVIGRAAAATPDEARKARPDIPWDSLARLADVQRGGACMTAGEMEAFLEREIPRLRRALKKA